MTPLTTTCIWKLGIHTTTPTPPLTFCYPYSSLYLLLPLLLPLHTTTLLLPLHTTTPTPPLTYYYPYSSPYLLLPLLLPLPTTAPTPPLTYYSSSYLLLLPLPTTTPTPPLTYYYPYSSPCLLLAWSEVTSMGYDDELFYTYMALSSKRKCITACTYTLLPEYA